MQRKDSRHTLLGHACRLALCYLLAGAGLASAQAPACNLPACHRVLVGPVTQTDPFGSAHFEDVDSGSRSDTPVGNGNPVITVIRAGETVQWEFF